MCIFIVDICNSEPFSLCYSSDGAKGPETKFKRAPVKALRHEDSAAVWNELALYQDKCRKLEMEL